MLSIAINKAEHVCATVIIKHNYMLMCDHKIVINIMLCFFNSPGHKSSRALTKRSISQNFQNVFFCIIHISLTFSILCQKILAENRLQSSFLGSIKTLYPIFRVGFDNQNTLSNIRVYNTSNLADNLYF